MSSGSDIMNYIIHGLNELRTAVLIGIPLYIVFFFFMYILKKRKKVSWKCILEMFFCVYSVLLIELTGILSLKFSFDGILNFSLIPFVGSSFIPVLLNFILFVPYGFLLPIVFSSCKWNWEKILCIGALTSFIIEILQLFGGRYAEIDDFIINTLGALSGYILYTGLLEIQKNKKKAVGILLSMTTAVIICFFGIFLISDHSKELPDGFTAVENMISEIQIYCNGESQAVKLNSEVYHYFNLQMSNCGGHLLKIKDTLENEVVNDTDCFIEILFAQPQNISFENAESFSISNADRVIYNSNKNILYWGKSNYQYYVDYTKLDTELEEHKSEVLAQYRYLQEMIKQTFK